MSILDKAIKLSKLGFHIFPLIPGKKKPIVDEFTERASTDIKKISSWWLDPVLEIENDNNIGISTEKFKNDLALVVVDVDNDKAKGKDGNATELTLALEGKEFPKTFTQTTTSGGFHYVYYTSSPVKQGAHVLGQDIDIRSKGGYIVGAGSAFNGKEYSCDFNEIVECPDWILEVCGSPNKKSEVKNLKPVKEINVQQAATKAIDYLLNSAPTSLEGEGGDETAYKVAAAVKDFGLDSIDCLDLMMKHWNGRCQPPWEADELNSKVEHAYTYGKKQIGEDAPENQFEVVSKDSTDEDSYLDRINGNHALILESNGYTVLHETVDEKGRQKRSFLSENAFKRMYSPYPVGQGKKAKNKADIWLDWKGRREYAGVCFRPEEKARNDYYNLWRGFTCKPKAYEDASVDAQKGFDAYKEHILENVCEGNPEYYNWVMGYFAHLIQNPCTRPLTTLVFKGRKGVGKNVTVDRVGKLLGHGHYLVAQNKRYLTSNFNGHLESCLMMVLDEAFWSGDKDADGILKGLTTSEEILIERKGKEPFMVDNLARLIIMGNAEWLVPASADERRYAVFNIGDGRFQDLEFFGQMKVNMDEKGGNCVLLDYLQNFDLKLSNVNVAPVTEALLEQKLSSLDVLEQYWNSSLLEGTLMGVEFGDGKWQDTITKEAFRKAFTKYCDDRKVRSRIESPEHISRHLKQFCPSMDLNHRLSAGEKRIRAYWLPTLETARREWETRMGKKIDWPAI